MMRFLLILLFLPAMAYASTEVEFRQCLESLCGSEEQIVKNRSKQTPIELSYFRDHIQRLDKAISNSYSTLAQSLQSIKQLSFNLDSAEQLDIERLAYLVGVNLLKQDQLITGQYDQLLQEVKRLEEQQAAKYPWRNSQIAPIENLISAYTRQLNIMSDLIDEESAYDPFAEDYFAPYVDYAERWLDHPEMLNHNDLSKISETMSWLSYQLGYKKPRIPQVNCLEYNCKTFITDGIFKLFQHSQNSDKRRCKAAFIEALKSSPTSEDIDSFQKTARLTIEQIRERIFPLLQLDSSAIQKFDKLEITLPRDRNKLAKDIILFLEKISSGNVQRWQNLNQNNQPELIRYLVESKLELNSSFQNVCSKLVPDITDYYDSKNHRINVSEYSAQNPSFGTYILSHEIGHALSKILPAKVDQKVKSCLQTLHINTGELLGAKHFVEEDFADVIAAITTYDSPKNGACLFWYQDANNNQYDIGVSSIYSYSVNDKHSSNFFRLLHLQQFRSEEMPTSCKASLQYLENHIDMRRCL